jgi:ElaB/YqjD/DUF883 family membrane-anchored ribosome-binding protein
MTQESGVHIAPSDPMTLDPCQPETAPSYVAPTASGSPSSLKEKATQLGERAASTIDENREGAARILDSAAAGLHKGAQSLPGSSRVSSTAHSAADRLEDAAAYVREHEVRDVVEDARCFVRDHPSHSLAAAVAAGFLVGRALRRR